MNLPTRPVPRPGLYEDEFWRRVQDRQVCLQRCQTCSHMWYPAGPVCPACLSERWEWEPIGGGGRVVAWTTFHRAYFKEIPIPHTVVSAALPEGPLLIADYGGDPSDLALGQVLQLEFIPVLSGSSASWSFRWVLPS